MKKALLIDGSNAFVRHFVSNPAIDKNGVPVGAVQGVLSDLFAQVKMFCPKIVILIFDGKGGSTQRRQAKKDYKSGRRPLGLVGRNYSFSNPDKLEKNKDYQTSVLTSILDLLPVCHFTTQGFEADDAIGYISKFRNYFDIDEVVISSCDKDFFQLIDKKTKIFNPQSKKIIDEAYVLKEFGVHPANWLFSRAVTGDASDNINGVDGFGFKTLAKVFDIDASDISFAPDDIEEVFSMIGEVENKALKKNIQKLFDNRQLIAENYRLMDLREPMMGSFAKEKVDFALKNFKPKLQKYAALRIITEVQLNLGYAGISNLTGLVLGTI